jgi:hypothetical protein
VILSHAEILSRCAHSRNRISCCYEFVTARGVMLGEFSNRCVGAKRSSRNADGSYAQVIGTEFKAAENSAALTRLLI